MLDCCHSLLAPNSADEMLQSADEQLSQQDERGERSPVRLAYLDGLRGLTAIYLVLFHCQACLSHRVGRPTLSLVSSTLLKAIEYGHYAVAVFIVLSGYVLMLQVVRSADENLRGGFTGFMKRRALRVLPTYYAALLIFSGLIYFVQSKGLSTEIAQITPTEFFQHLFLVQNLSFSSYLTIDAPMWSLATEWQIYFVFALALIPTYRRVGIYAAMFAAFVIGLAPHFVLPSAQNFDWACPWYLALFSCGMFAACVSFGTSRHNGFLRSKMPWGVFASGGLLAFVYFSCGTLPQSLDYLRQQWFLDIICGFSTAAFLMYCTGYLQALPPRGRINFFLRVLQSRPLVGLGAFSYTIYLFHFPLMNFAVRAIYHLHLPLVSKWQLGFSTVPFVVAFCYLAYCLCEGPFSRSLLGRAGKQSIRKVD